MERTIINLVYYITMLKECKEHGYFRGEKCPACNEEGRFLMNDEELERLGKMMAGALRHFPEKFNLKLDEHGWVNLYSFIDAVRARSNRFRWLRPHHLEAVVATDPKGRYQIKGNELRATYGHSVDVTMDLPTENIPERLYYPATPEEIDIILETGLKPVDRKMVHLSKTIDDARTAGSHRVENPVIIEVDAKRATENGFVIMQAGKTVYVVKEIPAKYLSKVKEQ